VNWWKEALPSPTYVHPTRRCESLSRPLDDQRIDGQTARDQTAGHKLHAVVDLLPIDVGHLQSARAVLLAGERPAWLANAHRELDKAVAAAYGWSEDISDDEALNRLFQLNQQRSQELI
jgi:hypothetical protein